MDSETIQITLSRIYRELDNIFQNRGWPKILDATNEAKELEALETALGSALFHVADLKLRVNRVLQREQQKHKEAG